MKKLEYAEGTNPQIFNRCLSKEEIKERYEFETKTKHLITKLHTKKAKEICMERVEFYKIFLDRLKKEIHGEL